MRYGRKGSSVVPSRTLSTILLINLVGFIIFFFYLTQQSNNDNTISNTAYVLPAKNAYITFTNNDAYAKGVVALAMSLMEVGSIYPLVVLVSKDVSSETTSMLANIGCLVYQTEMVALPPELSLQTARWGPAFTKLVSWKKIEYNKLMFMDSDLLVLQNVDDLFDQGDTLLATVDADASSCDFKPERLSMINSGVLVLQPSMPTYSHLIRTLHNKTLLASGAINDQDVIVNTLAWKGLEYPTYGAQVTHCECNDKRLWNLKTIKIIHFTAGLKKLPKPWDYNKYKHSEVPACVVHLYDEWTNRYDQALKLQ